MNNMIKNGVITALVLGVSVSVTAVAFGKSDDNSSAPTSEAVIESSAESVTDTELIIEPSAEMADSLMAAENIVEEKVSSVRALTSAPDCNSATKDDVFHMMINTIDYFNEASGTMMFSCGAPDNVTVVEFQTNMPQTESYSRVMTYSAGNTAQLTIDNLAAPAEYEAIMYCQNGEQIAVNAESGSASRSKFSGFTLNDAVEVKDEDRITTAPDGMPCVRYRSNPTNVEFSSMCLFPQEIAIGFLRDQDLWEIEGIKEFSGLNCYVIHGKASEDYGAKLNVAEFEFLVDVNTGVLVRYEGFDANGNLSDFMYTENLRFDGSVESVEKYSDKLVEGYSVG